MQELVLGAGWHRAHAEAVSLLFGKSPCAGVLLSAAVCCRPHGDCWRCLPLLMVRVTHPAYQLQASGGLLVQLLWC